MAQDPAAEQKQPKRVEDDNGFTVDYGKFSVVVMKEWGYRGVDDNYAYFLIDNGSKEVLAVDPKVWKDVVKPRWEKLNNKKDFTMKGILNTHKHQLSQLYPCTKNKIIFSFQSQFLFAFQFVF